MPRPIPTHPGRLPLLAGQSGIWFGLQLGTPGQHCNVGLCTDLRGPLDLPDFREAARRTVAETEALRLRFPAPTAAQAAPEEDPATGPGAGPWQRLGPPADWTLPVVDVADEAAARAWMRADLALATDAVRDPLFAFALLRVAPDRHFYYQRAHHLVLDGHGTALLLRRTAELYTALREGQDPTAGTLLPLAALHAAEQAYSSSAQHTADRAHWTAYLADRPRPVTLSGALTAAHGPAGTVPASRAPGPRDLVRGARHIPQECLDRLRFTARAARAEWSTVLVAAVAAYLHRMTGRDDILLSLPVANRATAAEERTPGTTANILPLRVRTGRATTVRSLVQHVRDETRQALHHQRYRCEDLLRDLRATGADPAGRQFGPVVDVMGSGPDISFAGTTGIAHRLASGPVEDMEFAAHPVPGGLQLRLTANPSRYAQADVDSHLGRFAAFLTAFAADPEAPVADVPVLLPGERVRLLEEWNDTGVEVAPGTVHGLFEDQAARTPQADAVVFGESVVPYGELNTWANRIAHGLIAAGVGPGDVVAVVLPRSVEMVAALLGVLKAGAACLPMDPDHPARRREFIREDAHAAFTVDASTVASVAAGRPGSDPEALVDPQTAAYVIYTSGSTGRPKGVVIPHSGVVNRLAWMQHAYRLTSDDRVLHKAPADVDVSVWELFWTLGQGAVLVVAEPGRHEDPAHLARVVQRYGVTTAHFAPSALRMFLRGPDALGCGSLRRVICSGEALPVEVRDAFFEVLPGVALHNLYGPTEASVDVTHAECWPGSPVVPIGRPVWNTRVYVLDSGLRPVPPGTPGELYLAGAQLAHGYAGRPGLTASAFLPDPYGPAGTRMYRTGDVAAWDTLGELVFLGRLDDQVKIRGRRVEPAEVQAVLAASPGVAQAAVVAREGRLVGYVVAGAGAVPDTSGLGERLPEHMVPSAVVRVEALPLTPNGELDREALPAPDAARGPGRGPRTPDEELLCGLFAQVLGIDGPLGIDEDFFALGGHSLHATRLVSRIRSVLGNELPLGAVFEAPTVAALAGRIRGAAAEDRPELTAYDRPRALPLSRAQRHLWSPDRTEGAGAASRTPLAVRLSGLLDVHALEAALADVVARHESLRTVLDVRDGEPAQRVLAGARPGLTRASATEEDLAQRLLAAVSRPFGPEDRLPLGAVLFVIAPTEHVLLLTVHRFACDGRSLVPLCADLSTAYRSRVEREAPRWEPLRVQYADYVLWQRELLGDEADPDSLISRQLGHWTSALTGIPAGPVLPADRPRSAVADQVVGSSSWWVPAGLLRGLRGLARESDTTLFMVVQAALAGLLSRLGAGEDVLIGTRVAGRTDVALDGLVGLFENTLVLRNDLSGDPSFRELLGRVRETDLRALAHQDVPFERLVEALCPDGPSGRPPLFRATLDFPHDADPVLDLPHVSSSAEPLPRPAAASGLAFVVRESADGGLDGTLEYSGDLLDQVGADLLGARLVRLLEAVVERPGLPLHTHELMGGDERRTVLEEWNDTAVDLVPATVHGLFESQSVTTPNRIALIHGDERVTYAELNARANRLAHRLIDRGAGAHTVVAVSLPRSVERVVALLAVLKSGAACLPADPRDPAGRTASEPTDVACVLHLETAGDVGDTAGLPGTNPVGPGDAPRRPAFVIPVPGAAGRPQCVSVRHEAVTGYLSHLHDLTGLGADDTVLSLAPLSSDASVRDLFGPLTAGAALVVPEAEHAHDPAALFALLRQHRVTVLPALDPTTLNALAGAARDAAGEDGVPSTWLRTGVVSGGELTSAQVGQAASVGSDWQLVNQYGPVESTMTATCHPVGPQDGRDGGPLPIGQPVSNARCYVLDRWLRPVPPGSTGELYLAGGGLADGYANRPGLTAERFLADPHAPRPGSRMYRTGDLARWRADGTLERIGHVRGSSARYPADSR